MLERTASKRIEFSSSGSSQYGRNQDKLDVQCKSILFQTRTKTESGQVACTTEREESGCKNTNRYMKLRTFRIVKEMNKLEIPTKLEEKRKIFFTQGKEYRNALEKVEEGESLGKKTSRARGRKNWTSMEEG